MDSDCADVRSSSDFVKAKCETIRSLKGRKGEGITWLRVVACQEVVSVWEVMEKKKNIDVITTVIAIVFVTHLRESRAFHS